MPPYTELDESQVREITSAYALGTVTGFNVLEGGSENSNYRIDVGDKAYVLTISENKSVDDVARLVKLLLHLEANGFISSRVIATSAGESLSSYKGKSILLKDFLHGEIIKDLDVAMLFKIGALIANLGRVPVPEHLQDRFNYGMDVLEVPDEFATHPFALWLAKVKDNIHAGISADLRKGLVHADLFYDNVVVSAEQEPFMMDFEEAGHYYLVFDLGMAIVGMCRSDGKINTAKIKAMLTGYQSVNPLNESERSSLKTFVVYAATVTAAWRFRQFHVTSPDEARKDRYQEMQQLADQALALPDAVFSG